MSVTTDLFVDTLSLAGHDREYSVAGIRFPSVGAGKQAGKNQELSA